MSDLTSLATRHAGRPLLMTQRAALELANRVRTVDPAAVVRPGRFSALLRRLSGAERRPMAMDDAEDYTPVPLETRLAYAPLYAGEPDDVGYCWALKDGVALMQVDKPLLDRGEIFCGEVYHGYDTILRGLREAAADDRVRAIFIREATPGGVVAGGLPALAAWMRENGARAGGKPIWVYADMACSAGYWIASGADRIVAPRVGLIGSIGAVIVHENWSGALKEAGIEITPIQFGEAKTDGAWWSALSPRAKADLQAEIDQCGRDFVADVVAGRPQLTPDAVLATQAAVFMGHHDEAERSALDLQLIDALASEEEAFAELRDLAAAAPADGGASAATLSVPGPTPQAAGARDRASASAEKEAAMALKTKAGAASSAKTPLAQAQAALRKAQARVAAIKAETDDEDQDEPAAEADEDDVDASSEADPAEDDEDGAAAEDDDEDQAEAQKTEAQKIAASPQAASHPRMANAAIASGLTYAQFKGQVKAASAGGQGRLAAAMSGAPRLGADAPAASGRGSGSVASSARETFARNRSAGLKAR